jgi:hypothetical protein
MSRAILLGFACPEGIWVGARVSEVQEAFVTTVMTLLRAHSTPHASSSGVGFGGDAIQSLTFFALVSNFQSSRGTSISTE